jgi:hypothetical protein
METPSEFGLTSWANAGAAQKSANAAIKGIFIEGKYTVQSKKGRSIAAYLETRAPCAKSAHLLGRKRSGNCKTQVKPP